jgi:thioredoxin reductase
MAGCDEAHDDFDVIVIGGGPAGENVVGRCADGGLKVALVEREHPATIAITGEVTVDRPWHAVPTFPTVSEVWLHLLDRYRV